jgi:hypothetical protein
MSTRHESVRNLLKMCAEKYGIPDIKGMRFTAADKGANPNRPPVYMSCHDKHKHPHFKDFCGPGHTFYKWNLLPHTFEETARQITNAGLSQPTIDKVGWYGRISCTVTAVEGHTRLHLNHIASKNKDKFDVVNTSRKTYKSMQDLTREYRYLIDVGGNGYSGRLKYLMHSGRPLIVVDRHYVEYFHYDIVPFVHYIPVKTDLSDLLEQEEWMRNNESKCEEIAQNALEFARNNFTKEKILERVFFVYKKMKGLI